MKINFGMVSSPEGDTRFSLSRAQALAMMDKLSRPEDDAVMNFLQFMLDEIDKYDSRDKG